MKITFFILGVDCTPLRLEFTYEKMKEVCSDTNVVFHTPYECLKIEEPNVDLGISLLPPQKQKDPLYEYSL